MIRQIECGFDQLPPYFKLPESIHDGMASIWDKSTCTGSEHVGAVTHSMDQYRILPLGHQAEGEVQMPIVSLSYQARLSDQAITREFMRVECGESEWAIRHAPNSDGVYYQGSILYLLPKLILEDHPDWIVPILPPGDMIMPEEECVGITAASDLAFTATD